VPVHDSVALGMFAGPACVIDGKYSYFLYPDDLSGENLNLYTLSLAHMTGPFDTSELRSSELVPPFDFTKGAPLLKIRLDPRNNQLGQDGQSLSNCETVLFDLENDPGQARPLVDPITEARLKAEIVRQFKLHDAPSELYGHFGLQEPHKTSTQPTSRIVDNNLN
jgi:hypothetical protein